MKKQKLYIDLDQAVHKRLRAKARQEKISMAALLRRAIDAELKKTARKGDEEK